MSLPETENYTNEFKKSVVTRFEDYIVETLDNAVYKYYREAEVSEEKL